MRLKLICSGPTRAAQKSFFCWSERQLFKTTTPPQTLHVKSSLVDNMALISAFTIIRAISLFHLTAAYFFLTNPRILSDQNIVFILGESIRVVCIVSTFS
jgi:hypothetical protein